MHKQMLKLNLFLRKPYKLLRLAKTTLSSKRSILKKLVRCKVVPTTLKWLIYCPAKNDNGVGNAADTTIFLNCFCRAGGVIVKAFATDFESLSQDGQLHVIVQNTGLVTADYFVSFPAVQCCRIVLIPSRCRPD